jgi:hypothetical protein
MFSLHFLNRSGIVLLRVILANKNVLLPTPWGLFRPCGRIRSLVGDVARWHNTSPRFM